MLLRIVAWTVAVGCLPLVAISEQSLPLPGSLRSLIDAESAAWPMPGTRAGACTSTDPEGKGNDHGHYVRVEGGEHVLADLRGPGVITRIWSANAQGRLRIRIDDDAEPVVDCLFEDLFLDRCPPFRSPISSTSSGGWYSYWPIAFAESCRVSVHEPEEVTRRRTEMAKPREIDLPLNGVEELTLVVTTGGDDFGFDHADWAEARVITSAGDTIHLADLPDPGAPVPDAPVALVSTRQGWGKLENGEYGRDGALGRNETAEGRPLRLAGVEYERGLGSHSPGEHVFALRAPCERFRAVIGIDDSKAEIRRGSVTFQVLADGVEVYDSGQVGFPQKRIPGTFEPDELYYHVNYLELPTDAEIHPFRRDLPAGDEDDLDDVLTAWANPARPPAVGAGARRDSPRARVEPGNRALLWETPGSGMVKWLRLRIDPADPRTLARTVVRVTCDDGETPHVWSPFIDLFGGGFGTGDVESFLVGRHGGDGYCRFVMPFADGIRVEIENGGLVPVDADAEVIWEEREPDRTPPGRFRARWRSDVTTSGELYRIVATRGEGAFMGMVLSIAGIGSCRGYLEGNEQFRVDGESVPSTVGTGTEDYFNGGWYYRDGPFLRPLHGVSWMTTSQEFGEAGAWTSQYRFQLPDRVPFHRSFEARIESGSTHVHLGNQYATVAYWYQVGPPVDDEPLPTAASLNLPRKILVRPCPAADRVARGNAATGVETLVGARFCEELLPTARALNGELRTASWEEISEGYRGTNRSLFNWWPRAHLLEPAADAPPYEGDVILCNAVGNGQPAITVRLPTAAAATDGDTEDPGTADAAAADTGDVLTLVLVAGPGLPAVDVEIGGDTVLEGTQCVADEVRPGPVLKIPVGAIAGDGDAELTLRADGPVDPDLPFALGVYCAGITAADETR